MIQTEKECYFCKTTLGLERHHIFYGVANRKLSEKDGCVVWLCREHHTGNTGVHHNRMADLSLKRLCQMAWQEKYGTKEDFIRRYGKSYL